MIDFNGCLISSAIKNILIGHIQENFEFAVGCQVYKGPRILAKFLSPRFCLSHSVDSSIAEYIAQNSDLNYEFALFLSLGSD
jgi:hypothetical protein